MFSVLTNTSAMTAVAALRSNQSSLDAVQRQISTGLRVSSASDDPFSYAAATSLRSTVSDLGSVQSSLGAATSVIGVASSTLTSVTGALTQIKTLLVAAQQSNADLTSIGSGIKSLQGQIAALAGSAGVGGLNLLNGSATTAQFASSVGGSGANTKVGFLSVDATQSDFGTNAATSKLSVAVAANASLGTTAATVDVVAMGTGTDANLLSVSAGTTSQTLVNYVAAVGTAIDNANKAQASLGVQQSNVSLAASYASTLTDALNSGIGNLVDADLNQASARLSALQTQQQLGVQALAVANQSSQLILKLFQ